MANWNDTPLEKGTEKSLISEFGSDIGKTYFSRYLVARTGLVEQILPEIKGMMPAFTDHGPDHVRRVLENMHQLIKAENEDYPLSSMESLVLIHSALFHDVGNIEDRKDHQHRIGKIYDFIRGGAQHDDQEKLILLQVTGAHCGNASDGSRDTIKELEKSPSQLWRKSVRLRNIAAILRLADELDEGEKRVSHYMVRHGKIPEESRIHHDYAQAVRIAIDKGNGRIALTYHLRFDSQDGYSLETCDLPRLEQFIEYAKTRIAKLNEERLYTRYYSEILQPFKQVIVVFMLWRDDSYSEVRLPDLTDLVVPQEPPRPLEGFFSEYQTREIINAIRNRLS